VKKKPSKFKGPAFSANTDYQALAQTANQQMNNTVLDPIQKIKILNRMEESVQQRLDFNKSRYAPKKEDLILIKTYSKEECLKSRQIHRSAM